MIRVLIAEDQHLIRGAQVALIELQDDMEVIADLDRGDTIVAAAERTRPDVAVLDIDLPGIDGLTAAGALRTALPNCQVLILTGLSQPGHVLRALELHARGFLLKDAPAARLAEAIRRVAARERVLDPDLVADAVQKGITPLSARETDVLRAMATGGSTTEIAATLFLSPATVRNYLSSAADKFGARTRIDAIRSAHDAGWI